MPKTQKQKVGKLGEDIACEFLENKGFSIVERNYLKKYGEIDIIAQKTGVIHFIEVKTVSRENISDVSRETERYRPEDNIHPWKLGRISRTIQIYLSEKNIPTEAVWKFDIVAIFLHEQSKRAKVRFLQNIIL